MKNLPLAITWILLMLIPQLTFDYFIGSFSGEFYLIGCAAGMTFMEWQYLKYKKILKVILESLERVSKESDIKSEKIDNE